MIKNVFNKDYIIDSKILNLLGIQPLRYILAKIIYNFRSVFFLWDKSIETQNLLIDGIIIIENFLDNEEFENFKKNFDEIGKIGKNESFQSGDVYIQRNSIDTSLENKYINLFLKSKKILNILSAVERRDFNKNKISEITPVVWVEKLLITGSSIYDSQKDLHSDIFFNTHKLWYYPEEVNSNSGPTAFIKKSHTFSFKRIILEYLNSINEKKIANIRDKDFNLTKYDKEKKIINVKANTLVIANTHGFHCRTSGKIGSYRKQLHFRIKKDPFNKILRK